MPQEHADRRSLHERIAADLRDEILVGDLPPGANLPSTVQLKGRFEASSATVQKAVQLLKDEGLVVGRAGAAVTVRESRQHTLRPSRSLEPAEPGRPFPWLTTGRSAEQATSTLLQVAEVCPPADVRDCLGLAPTEKVVMRRQLLSVDAEPVELVAAYYPLALAQGTPLTEHRKIKGGSPALLDRLGHPPRSSQDRVSARVPTQEQYEALRLPGNLPVLRTLRVVFAAEGRPLEATVMIKAGHLHEVEYEFTSG